MKQNTQTDVSTLFPYRVLDLSNQWGLFCGKILSDMGADVIKVEPPGGDPTRKTGPYFKNSGKPEESLFWFAFNTNKKSITLNIETEEGQNIIKEMVKNTDFIIESFQPGYMAKLGLSYEELSKINPGLIMVSVSAFGQTGPFADYKATDLTVTALGLLLNECGNLDRPPVQVGFPQTIGNAGADAAVGAMIAHYHRQMNGGEGQHVDVSAMESVLWPAGEVMPEFFLLGLNSSRVGKAFVRPNGLRLPVIWEAKDGYISYLLLGGAPGAKANRGITELLIEDGICPDYLAEKKWAEWDFDSTTQEDLEMITKPFAEYFKKHTKEEIISKTLVRGISCYTVTDASDVVNEEQSEARKFWINVEHDELNATIKYPGPFAVFSETPIKAYRRPALPGEDNEDIYGKELGYDSNKLSELKSKNII